MSSSHISLQLKRKVTTMTGPKGIFLLLLLGVRSFDYDETPGRDEL